MPWARTARRPAVRRRLAWTWAPRPLLRRTRLRRRLTGTTAGVLPARRTRRGSRGRMKAAGGRRRRAAWLWLLRGLLLLRPRLRRRHPEHGTALPWWRPRHRTRLHLRRGLGVRLLGLGLLGLLGVRLLGRSPRSRPRPALLMGRLKLRHRRCGARAEEHRQDETRDQKTAHRPRSCAVPRPIESTGAVD